MECVDTEIRVQAISNLAFFSKKQHNYFVPFFMTLFILCSKAISVETIE